MHLIYEMIGKHFTETTNEVKLRINHVWINRTRPIPPFYMYQFLLNLFKKWNTCNLTFSFGLGYLIFHHFWWLLKSSNSYNFPPQCKNCSPVDDKSGLSFNQSILTDMSQGSFWTLNALIDNAMDLFNFPLRFHQVCTRQLLYFISSLLPPRLLTVSSE